MPPHFHMTPAPRVAVRDWHSGLVALGVGGDMVDLTPQLAREVAVALVEAAQLVEGGDAYAAALAGRRPEDRRGPP
jgi:hypothetical protein